MKVYKVSLEPWTTFACSKTLLTLFPSDVPVHRLGREKVSQWQDDNKITIYSEIFALVHFGDFSHQHDKLCILGISKGNS